MDEDLSITITLTSPITPPGFLSILLDILITHLDILNNMESLTTLLDIHTITPKAIITLDSHNSPREAIAVFSKPPEVMVGDTITGTTEAPMTSSGMTGETSLATPGPMIITTDQLPDIPGAPPDL